MMNIPGLYYIENLPVGDLLGQIDAQPWQTPFGPAGRKVQHYGYIYDYKSKNIRMKCDDFTPCIAQLRDILKRICIERSICGKEYVFNQCIVNNYEPGQGISEHIDFPGYGDVIGCFTLGGGAVMRFCKGSVTKDLYVAPNTLYIMSGDARRVWTHQMRAVKSDEVGGFKTPRTRRVSVTFRCVPPL